MLMKLLITS